MSECKSYRHEIAEAWEGRVLSRGARAHVESCRACRDELRGRERLRALVGGLGKVEAPADFEFRLRARMAAAKGAGGGSPRGGTRLIYSLAPVAAAACFLIISSALYFKQPSEAVPTGGPRGAESESARTAGDAVVPQTHVAGEGVGTGVTRVRNADGVSGSKTLGTEPIVHRPRATGRRVRGAVAKAASPGNLTPSMSTNSFGSEPATRRNVTIALKAPAEPLRMILRDERGVGRVVPVRAVSFGAQELVARSPAVARPSAEKVEGVW